MLESLSEKSARPFHRRAFILRRKTTEQKAREAAVFTNAGACAIFIVFQVRADIYVLQLRKALPRTT